MMSAPGKRRSLGLPLSETTPQQRRARSSPRRQPTGVLWRDKRKEWRWFIMAANKRHIAEGGESYKRRIDALRMLERAMDGFGCSHYEVDP